MVLGLYFYVNFEVLVIIIVDSVNLFCLEVFYFFFLFNFCGDFVDFVEVGFDEEVVCGELFFCWFIRVSNFNEVLVMQFSINYDIVVLCYIGVQNFMLDLFVWMIIGVGQFMFVGSFLFGQMSIYWVDFLVVGVSLDDGIVLVEVCFEVLQEINYELLFMDQLLFIEFLDVNEEVMEVNFYLLFFYCGFVDLVLDIKLVLGVIVVLEMFFLLDIELFNEGLCLGMGIEVYVLFFVGILFVGSDGNYDLEMGFW